MIEERYESPLSRGEQPLAHWAYTVDLADRDGSGSNSGEFLLRNDGQLLRRRGWDRFLDGATTWHFEPWLQVADWAGTADPVVLFAWLTARGYVLFPPTTTPVDHRVGQPIPGSRGSLAPLQCAESGPAA